MFYAANPPHFSLNNTKELPLDTTESNMARPQDTPSLTNEFYYSFIFIGYKAEFSSKLVTLQDLE